MAAGLASILVTIVALIVYRPGQRAQFGEGDNGSLFGVLSRDIVVASASGILLVASQMCLLTYLVAYLIHDRGLSLTTAAGYLAAAQATGVLGRVVWGVVSDRVLSGSRRRTLLLAAGTGACGSLALAILPSTVPFPILAIALLICAGEQSDGMASRFRSCPSWHGREVRVGQLVSV